jgi:hypothetical protein
VGILAASILAAVIGLLILSSARAPVGVADREQSE